MKINKQGRTIIKKRAKVLYIAGKIIYAQIGNRLCSSKDNGETWMSYPVRLPESARTFSNLHARLTRRGIHCLDVLKDKSLLLVAKGVFYKYEIMSGNIERSFSILRGSRPLFVCQGQEGSLFWGEYFRNPVRDEVNIYTSEDCAKTWHVKYKFKRNSIRHVHGIFYDPYDKGVWVTTGDENRENAIWMTSDGFKTLEMVIGGDQQSRAIQLIFTRDYVYYGTDTPYEINRICRIDKRTGMMETLADVDGSVYWGCKINGALFFSTAVEPSSVNRGRYASIWGSGDGTHWRQIEKYRKDIWPMKYCQVGQLYFPQGENKTDYLFFTPIATECNLTLQRIYVADLF
ncbi:MAG: hypothetical protein ACUZ8N_01385 [Candidatus Scalindua sp.]